MRQSPPELSFKQFVALIASLTALNALAIDSMLPALPQIGAALHVASDNERQWVITAYLLGVSSTQMIYGVLADRFGRKRVLLTGVSIYACFAIVAAFATSMPQLVAARGMMGAGAAAVQVLAVSIVRDRFSGAQMARVMSLTFMVFLTAPVLAPSIGQAIMLASSWRMIFAFLATFSLILLVWAGLRLPETLHPEDRLPLELGRIAQAFRAVFSSRVTVGYMLAAACVLGGLFGFINSVQQVFTDIFHAPKVFPAIFACVAIGMAISSLLNARIVERLGARHVSHRALLGFIMCATAHLIVARSGYESILTFAVLQGGMLFCFGMVASNFSSIAMEPLGHVAGTGSSVYGSITMAVGSSLGFLIGQQFDGTAIPLTLGYVVCGVAALVIIVITERGAVFGRPVAACSVALLALNGCSRADFTRRTGDAAPIAVTHTGRFRPTPAQVGVLSYLGVPYARQPVGVRRWAEPDPLPASDSLVDAAQFGHTCRQRADENEPASATPQGEDCLSLNVWTRTGRLPRRPVMVWIHGGANVSGGTADPFYSGQEFVRDNDVVMVSINYRLGPFGFLDLSGVGDSTFARSRNLGLLDQLAALRWIRANIAAFGGDSANITVFGESAGGSAIMRLMAMPLARGLFDKAIIESGGPANIRVRGVPPKAGIEAGLALTREVMAAARAPDIAALQALSGDSILAMAERVAVAHGDALAVSTWGARADNVVLPEDLFGEVRRGASRGVKVLIGTNEDEMLYFRLYDTDFERSVMREYREKSSVMGRSFATVREIADQFTANSTDPMRYVDFTGEFWLRQPSILFAEGSSRVADTYMYLWTWDSARPGMGAAHSIELPFVFGHLSGPTVEHLTGPNPPAALSRRIQAAWTAFATNGNPTAPGEPEWPRYTEATRATLILDAGPWRVVVDPKREARVLLSQMFDVGR